MNWHGDCWISYTLYWWRHHTAFLRLLPCINWIVRSCCIFSLIWIKTGIVVDQNTHINYQVTNQCYVHFFSDVIARSQFFFILYMVSNYRDFTPNSPHLAPMSINTKAVIAMVTTKCKVRHISDVIIWWNRSILCIK